VHLFEQTSPRHLDEMRDALTNLDAKRLTRAAHTFKGAVSTFAAAELTQAIRDLEDRARAGDFSRAAECFVQVQEKVPRLSAALSALIQEPAAT
jgi:two-component system, sensor histidine kinase and response regulator